MVGASREAKGRKREIIGKSNGKSQQKDEGSAREEGRWNGKRWEWRDGGDGEGCSFSSLSPCDWDGICISLSSALASAGWRVEERGERENLPLSLRLISGSSGARFPRVPHFQISYLARFKYRKFYIFTCHLHAAHQTWIIFSWRHTT